MTGVAMDKLQAMQIFVKVAECASFTKASQLLDLPPATVTTAVKTLERRLGVQLMHRTTRKVALTEEGSIYLDRCTRLLADVDDAEALFAGSGAKPSGVVRIDLPERTARLMVIPALPDFFAQFPDIQLKLSSSDRFIDLVGEGVDLVVRAGILTDSSLIARTLGSMQQINCASPHYLNTHGRPASLAALREGHYAVNFFSSRTGRDLPWEYMENGELHTLKLPSRVSVASSEAYVACALAGMGLIQAPREGIQGHLQAGELEEVLPAQRPAPLPVSIVYAHNRHLSQRVRAVVDWMAAILVLD